MFRRLSLMVADWIRLAVPDGAPLSGLTETTLYLRDSSRLVTLTSSMRTKSVSLALSGNWLVLVLEPSGISGKEVPGWVALIGWPSSLTLPMFRGVEAEAAMRALR